MVHGRGQGVVVGSGAEMAVPYVPLFNDWLKTQPLTPGELAFCLVMSSVVFFAVELEKLLIRQGRLYGLPAEGR